MTELLNILCAFRELEADRDALRASNTELLAGLENIVADRDHNDILSARVDALRAENARLREACQRSLKHYESIRAEDRDDSPLMACLRKALASKGAA